MWQYARTGLYSPLFDICERQCYPPISFRTEVDSTESPPIVGVFVPPSPNKPHFSGPAFVRKGEQSPLARALPSGNHALTKEKQATRSGSGGVH